MSDDEKDIDVESDDDFQDDDFDDGDRSGVSSPGTQNSEQFMTQAEKRAHHNALERKRRDHIKESFTSLRDAVPVVHGEKVSRAQILKKTAEYISFMRRKNHTHQRDIDDIKKQNHQLENKIRQLEKLANAGQYAAGQVSCTYSQKQPTTPVSNGDEAEYESDSPEDISSSSNNNNHTTVGNSKRLKTSH